jgi:hypothetical protein
VTPRSAFLLGLLTSAVALLWQPALRRLRSLRMARMH